MSLIITATDFSDVAHDAVNYACKLAQKCDAALAIVHAYSVPVSFTENPMPVMPIEESRQIAEKSLADLIAALTVSYPGLSISSHLTYGSITDGLVEYAENRNPLLIVVGNSLSEEGSFWFGGNLLQLMRDMPHPVLAVPHGITITEVKNICFACDYKRVSDHLPASDLLRLVQVTGASLQVLNIDHNNQSFGTETPIESTSLHQMIGAAHPTYHYMDNANVDEGIQNFVAENRVDWLVVTPHKHNFIEGLFHRSRTRALARHMHIPILALHEI